MPDDQPSHDPPDGKTRRSSQFRFKASKAPADHDHAHRRRKRHHRDASPSRSSHRHHSHRRRSRSPRRHHSDRHHEEQQQLDPDTAFRESLFDALADDEGAAYWEGVYGQPIHIYPNVKPASASATGDDDGTPALEQMDEEEYAAYVRARMWEKTHAHIVEERARREAERRRRREARAQDERAAGGGGGARGQGAFDAMIEDALRRGEQRRRLRGWELAWREYVDRWARLRELAAVTEQTDATPAAASVEQLIPWPVQSGQRADVTPESVRAFFAKHPTDELPRLLKVERVQWHPDKMQQRLRGRRMDGETLRSVTAVFQIVDDMWADVKRT